MEKLKNIFRTLLGLFVLYLVISLIWSVLNMQKCSYDLPENPTCEQMAENNVKNCKYIIFWWKNVDYDKELKECKEWERKQIK